MTGPVCKAPLDEDTLIAFEAASDEVVLAPKIAYVRTLPSHSQRVRLVAVDDGGERVIGDYTFNHSAHETA